MEDKYIVALEVGSSKIRGALASIDVTGIVNILSVQEERLTDSVRYGQVKNVDEVSGRIDSIIRKLENTKAILPRRIRRVYVGISGFSIGTATTTDSIRFDSDTEITSQIVNDLREKGIALHQTDKEIYDVVPYEYVIDNESTLQPVGRIGKDIKATFKVIEGNAGIKNNLKRVVEQRLELEISGSLVSAIAEADVVLSNEEKQLGSMMVDFGAETTTVAIYKGNVLRSLVTLPMGSRNITRDLMSLNYLEEQAESLKRSVGVVNPADGTPRFTDHTLESTDVSSYIMARASEIVANIVAQIDYAGMKPADLPSGIVLIGGGARLKGFSDLIVDQSSKMKVRLGTAPRNIRISDASILADDMIDVISLVITASKGDLMQCVEEVRPAAETVSDSGIDDIADGDLGESRIGRYDDDDVLEDDYEDRRRKLKEKKKNGERTTASRPPKVHTESIFGRIRNKMMALIEDNIDDKFEDDDDENENK